MRLLSPPLWSGSFNYHHHQKNNLHRNPLWVDYIVCTRQKSLFILLCMYVCMYVFIYLKSLFRTAFSKVDCGGRLAKGVGLAQLLALWPRILVAKVIQGQPRPDIYLELSWIG